MYSAVPVHRRRWLLIGLAVVAVLVIATVLAGPRVTCRYLQRQTPLDGDAVIIRGVQYQGAPPRAMVVGRCAPAVFKHIVEGASGRWLPGFLLADGQHAWGTFTDAPEITWRLDLDQQAAEPVITARIPVHLAERILARTLADQRLPVSAVHLRTAQLTGVPLSGVSVTAWHAQVAGSAVIDIGGSRFPVTIDGATASLALEYIPQPTGDRHLRGELIIDDLRGSVPFIGSLTPLLDAVQKQANQRLGQELPNTLVPNWWPTATHWDLEVVPGGVAEF